MSDIGYPNIPCEVIETVFDRIELQPDTKFLLLTKNPKFYNDYIWSLPDNVVCGATIETDLVRVSNAYTFAPDPTTRIDELVWASCNRDDLDYFACIEPVLRFSSPTEFARKIRPFEPWGIAVGYDNYGNELDEPPLHETLQLVKELKKFTTVYEKTIRKAWWET